MYTRILVPLDGSSRAERTLELAVVLARRSGGTLILMRAIGFGAEFGPPIIPSALEPTAVNAEHDEARTYLDALARSNKLQGIPTERLVVFGSPATTILDVAEEYHADMIALCSHGRTGFTRWALGSVAQHVARHSPVPVLVLRDGGTLPTDRHADFEHLPRVLVPLDGSALAEEALAPAAALAAALTAPAPGALHLVRVVQIPGEDVGPAIRSELLREARTYLTETTERLRSGIGTERELTVTWSVAVDMDVAGGILRVAESGDDTEGAGVFGGCDVIAIATHGRTGLAHWTIGSITERVLSAAKLPLLIVRPVEMRQPRQPRVERPAEEGSDIPTWSGLF
jgi:nucleotide-binding universal stress UspA family protein